MVSEMNATKKVPEVNAAIERLARSVDVTCEHVKYMSDKTRSVRRPQPPIADTTNKEITTGIAVVDELDALTAKLANANRLLMDTHEQIELA